MITDPGFFITYSLKLNVCWSAESACEELSLACNEANAVFNKYIVNLVQYHRIINGSWCLIGFLVDNLSNNLPQDFPRASLRQAQHYDYLPEIRESANVLSHHRNQVIF